MDSAFSLSKVALAVLIGCCSPIFAPTFADAPTASAETPAITEPATPYVLTVNAGLISLEAREASLRDVLEELGRKGGFEVFAYIPRDETITLVLREVPVVEAVKQLTAAANTVKEWEMDQGTLKRLIVLPQGMDIVPPPAVAAPSAAAAKEVKTPAESASDSQEPADAEEHQAEREPNAPFEFQFDPAAAIK